MIQLDPQDLIDIPGAGRAETACQQTGNWDDGRAEGAIDWVVEVWATKPVVQMVKVRAVDAATAKMLAGAKARHEGRWEDWDLAPTVTSVEPRPESET